MGMVVRTNMAAINANNSLQQASKAQQNGMQKLASGFKINKAADDASGLAISEKMKAQIKALDTSKDNCEDGANLIQTAEGYMAETHAMLNRMVELSEKSANGVLEDTDRDALQKEMDELCGEIDRMATTANFNGRKLMDGSIGSSAKVKITSDPATGKNGYKLEENSEYGKKFSISAVTFATGGSVSGTAPTANSAVTGNVSGMVTHVLGNNASATDVAALTKKLTDAIYSMAEKDTKVDASMAEIDKELSDAQEKYEAAMKALKENTDPDKNSNLMDDVKNALKAVTTAQNHMTSGQVSTAASLDNIESKMTVYVNKDGDIYTTFDASDAKATELEKDLLDGNKNLEGYNKYEVKLSLKTEKQDVDAKEGIKLQIGESSTGADKMEVKISSFHTDSLLSGIDGFQNLSADSTSESDAKAVAAVKKNEAATYSKGITIDISDQNKASAAADALRQVSNFVSDERGKLGAKQNRLEHTVNNLSTASENISAANSRIRDTDMAKEMMAYTSKNVIAQAAQSMLAQANSQPQNVLSLLQ